DGRVISANGRHLWFYNPARAIAGKQDLKGGTGGLYGLLNGYESVTSSGRTLKLQSSKKYYEEIIINLTPNNMLQSIRMKRKGADSAIEISFSGIQTNLGLPSSIFNYHPPSSAQIVENPLNQRE
ncbi:MAG: outer membrane lipoprotein carrier protein LolA, partial [Leptospiraceae bacterium]|nr:outer membrane lipoprotein carrier protein LolA [Leptospiraceae bacterium]